MSERAPLSASWSSIVNLAPMQWSLGIIGDLTWNVFPELRTGVRETVDRHLEWAITAGLDKSIEHGGGGIPADQLSRPDGEEYLIHVLGPAVVGPVAEGTASPDIVDRLANFVRLALTYEGPEKFDVRRSIEDFLLEPIDTPAGISALNERDAELVRFVRARIGMWLTDLPGAGPIRGSKADWPE